MEWIVEEENHRNQSIMEGIVTNYRNEDLVTLYILLYVYLHSVQFSRSVMSDSLRPHEYSTPGLPVHHQLPEFTQTHVHRVSDAIQPSHPLPSPFPPAPHDLMLCLCRQENKIRVGMTNALFTQNSLILSNILSFGMQPLIFFIK